MAKSATVATTAPPQPQAQLDAVGIFWITWASVWTVFILSGMGFLFQNRRMPLLRMRGLPLSFAAVVLLHIYWISVQIGYIIGPFVPDGAEFWVMGLWLPFGIALFHAANSRFLDVSSAQKKFAVTNAREKATASSKKTILSRLRCMGHTKRMLVFVGTGMVLQLLLTVIMWLISRKYHPWFGVPGTEVNGSPLEIKLARGKGWEWWPSVFWQFVWAWIIAPVILWKSRKIHDTIGWRFQTIACCLSNLHATPMWLIALYVPEMAPVNAYWIPPQWLCLSIMLLEIFTIFIPCWQVLRHQTLRQETLEAIAAWEYRNNGNGDSSTAGSRSSKMAKSLISWNSMSIMEKGSRHSATSCCSESLLTMGALEHVLTNNPNTLRHFSAFKDFSGENIAFLTTVAEWKGSLVPKPTSDQLSEQFTGALRIYSDFISPRDAEFPINISSTELKNLVTMFERAARILYGDKPLVDPDMITPFEGFKWPMKADPLRLASQPSKNAIHGPATDELNVSTTELRAISKRVQYWGDIPEGFDGTVFDNAETSIKYLVLTNTWPKFVKERRQSMDSHNSEDTYGTQCPKLPVLGRLLKRPSWMCF
ncbi:uncharacterized protein BCR38DRAFT_408136 [Pseudomassariella vexata]|uniref:RGS domain-containing protein n=1 Tax=Pseudomassariella vexata TaxID=1141098 RepID=A0A1Y2E3N3_9PEZI|nr:uncharacterized protein BCR38DRAFT_408136 [Pseudomassariella vexata]ORY66168.1 hypothetical protein BCR38DRAFT_408136 [Pseudomassariella vexata]